MVKALTHPRQFFIWAATLLVAGASLLWLTTDAFAQQRDFALRDYGYKTGYAYQWQDHYGQTHTTRFHLNKDMVRKAANEFKPFSNHEANTYVFSTVQSYASRLQTRGISMTIEPSSGNGKVEITAKGTNRQALQREMQNVDTLIEESREKYIHDKLFRLYDEDSVVPDHARITRLNARRVRPVAHALLQSAPRDVRGQINHTLAFLQGIPYDELLNRSNSNGAGFAPPIELLTRNLGDCDSKSVAMASLLKNSHPRMPMVLVLVEGHAFVGVGGIRQGPNDFALKIDNRTYVLAEPAGPAMLPLGQIDQRSQRLLRTGNFQHVAL